MEVNTKFNIGDRVQFGAKGQGGEVATIRGVKFVENSFGRSAWQYVVDWNDDSGEVTYPQGQMDDMYQLVPEVQTYRVMVRMLEYRNVWVNAPSEDEARRLVEEEDWYGAAFPVDNKTLDSMFDGVVTVEVCK